MFSYWWSSSTNDGVPKGLCSLTYITIYTAMEHIKTLGPGTASKIDIKSAFRLLSVYPADHHLPTVMKWYMPSIWIVLCSKAVQYLSRPTAAFQQTGLECPQSCMHYLEGFLTLGPPDNHQRSMPKLGCPTSFGRTFRITRLSRYSRERYKHGSLQPILVLITDQSSGE